MRVRVSVRAETRDTAERAVLDAGHRVGLDLAGQFIEAGCVAGIRQFETTEMSASEARAMARRLLVGAKALYFAERAVGGIGVNTVTDLPQTGRSTSHAEA